MILQAGNIPVNVEELPILHPIEQLSPFQPFNLTFLIMFLAILVVGFVLMYRFGKEAGIKQMFDLAVDRNGKERAKELLENALGVKLGELKNE